MPPSEPNRSSRARAVTVEIPGTAASMASATDSGGMAARGTRGGSSAGTVCLELRELRPQVAAAHGAVQVEHRLALDGRVVAERVVPRRKRQHLDLGSKRLEQPRHPASPLLHVNEDPHLVRHAVDDRPPCLAVWPGAESDAERGRRSASLRSASHSPYDPPRPAVSRDPPSSRTKETGERREATQSFPLVLPRQNKNACSIEAGAVSWLTCRSKNSSSTAPGSTI